MFLLNIYNHLVVLFLCFCFVGLCLVLFCFFVVVGVFL